MPVTQVDIAEFIGDLFTGGPIERSRIVHTARRRGARPAVLDVLRNLPRAHYRRLADLLTDLSDLPAAFDPWEASTG